MRAIKIKSILIAILITLPATFVFSEYTNYVVDINFTDSDISISLPLDDDGYAKRDYDCFLSYPSSFETAPSFHAAEWEKRGLGLFAEISATTNESGFELDVKLDDAFLTGWKDNMIGNNIVRMPIISANSVNTTILAIPDMWVSFVKMNIRVREIPPNHH